MPSYFKWSLLFILVIKLIDFGVDQYKSYSVRQQSEHILRQNAILQQQLQNLTKTYNLVSIITNLTNENQNLRIEVSFQDEINRVLMNGNNVDFFSYKKANNLYYFRLDSLKKAFDKRINEDLTYQYETDSLFRKQVHKAFFEQVFEKYEKLLNAYDSNKIMQILKEVEDTKY